MGVRYLRIREPVSLSERNPSTMAATDVVAFFLRCNGPLESELLSFSQRLDTTPDEFRSNHYAMHSVVFAVEADDGRVWMRVIAASGRCDQDTSFDHYRIRSQVLV